jgi:hypothetical protein
LEEECALLRKTQLSKNGNLGASNHISLDIGEQGGLREENIVQQLFEAIEICDFFFSKRNSNKIILVIKKFTSSDLMIKKD